MKKALAYLLLTCFIVNLSGCRKTDGFISSLYISSVPEVSKVEQTASEETGAEGTVSEEQSLAENSISSIEELVESLEESDSEITESVQESSSVEVELTPPEKTEVEQPTAILPPAIPTIGAVAGEGEDQTAENASETLESADGQVHSALKYTERYLYSTLDERFKGYYRKIDNAVCNLQGSVYLDSNITTDDCEYIYFLYMFDNPEHFYLGNQIAIYCENGTKYGLIFSYSDGVNSCTGGQEITDALRNSIKAKKAVFEEKVKSVISTIPAYAENVVKEKMIYDYIILNSSYNLNPVGDSTVSDDWTAYGVLVNKTGVCESYSEAFQLLCLMVGINCTGVEGIANGGGHKWNAVQLDGEWYLCDITFDDPIGGNPQTTYHNYFNVTTAQLQEAGHIVNSKWLVPTCVATKYSYQNYFSK